MVEVVVGKTGEGGFGGGTAFNGVRRFFARFYVLVDFK